MFRASDIHSHNSDVLRNYSKSESQSTHYLKVLPPDYSRAVRRASAAMREGTSHVGTVSSGRLRSQVMRPAVRSNMAKKTQTAVGNMLRPAWQKAQPFVKPAAIGVGAFAGLKMLSGDDRSEYAMASGLKAKIGNGRGAVIGGYRKRKIARADYAISSSDRLLAKELNNNADSTNKFGNRSMVVGVISGGIAGGSYIGGKTLEKNAAAKVKTWNNAPFVKLKEADKVHRNLKIARVAKKAAVPAGILGGFGLVAGAGAKSVASDLRTSAELVKADPRDIKQWVIDRTIKGQNNSTPFDRVIWEDHYSKIGSLMKSKAGVAALAAGAGFGTAAAMDDDKITLSDIPQNQDQLMNHPMVRRLRERAERVIPGAPKSYLKLI